MLLGNFMLKLMVIFRSDADFVRRLEESVSSVCFIAGGSGSSLSCVSLLSVEAIGSSGSEGFEGVRDIRDVIVSVAAAELNPPDFSVAFGEGIGDDLFRDRTPHRAAIIAIVAANPTATSENESSGGLNGFSFVGILLPMTKTSKNMVRSFDLCFSHSVSLALFLFTLFLSLCFFSVLFYLYLIYSILV